jgi:uncharacterized protein (TIGR02599 family)
VQDRRAFTLIELLVAMAVFSIVAFILLSMTTSVQKVAKQTSSRAEQFRESRRAFERINQRLSQATLNPYYDYVNGSGNPRTTANAASFTPSRYARISELRFLQTNASAFTAPFGGSMKGLAVFFQAPLARTDSTSLSGLGALLNTVGYFIEKGDDSTLRPPTTAGLAAKNRFRVFEFVEPTENFSVYRYTSGNATYSGTSWATESLANSSYSYPLAENIVALVFSALYPNAAGAWQTNNTYSSAPTSGASQAITDNNLPPKVRISMIAVDDPSARRMEDASISLTDATNTATLDSLEKQLIDNRLNYRRFESTVTIGSAKWSAK